jgi:hypothetical protein
MLPGGVRGGHADLDRGPKLLFYFLIFNFPAFAIDYK